MATAREYVTCCCYAKWRHRWWAMNLKTGRWLWALFLRSAEYTLVHPRLSRSDKLPSDLGQWLNNTILQLPCHHICSNPALAATQNKPLKVKCVYMGNWHHCVVWTLFKLFWLKTSLLSYLLSYLQCWHILSEDKSQCKFGRSAFFIAILMSTVTCMEIS